MKYKNGNIPSATVPKWVVKKIYLSWIDQTTEIITFQKMLMVYEWNGFIGGKWLLSLKIDTASRVQILDKAA